MATVIEQFKNLVRYWWAMLILGVAITAVGVLVFIYPIQSYGWMAIAFGAVILVSGILHMVMGISEKYLPGRGWLIVEAIIEIVLGIILLFNIGLTTAALPFFLAFWLLFRGLSLLGIGIDLSTMKISGMGWTIVAAVLLILCGILVLLSPAIVRTSMIIALVGVGFLVAGIAVTVFAFDLLGIQKRIKNAAGW